MTKLAMIMATALVLAGSASSGAALAQNAAPAAMAAPADDPVKLDLARRLVELNGGQAAVDTQIKSMFTIIQNGLKQSLPAAQSQLTDALYSDMEDEMHTLTPQLIDISVRAYAENYTTEELRDLLAFQSSDTGRAIAKKGPMVREQAMRQTIPLVMAALPAIMRKTADRVCAEVKCTPAQRQVVADAMAKAMQRQGG